MEGWPRTFAPARPPSFARSSNHVPKPIDRPMCRSGRFPPHGSRRARSQRPSTCIRSKRRSSSCSTDQAVAAERAAAVRSGAGARLARALRQAAEHRQPHRRRGRLRGRCRQAGAFVILEGGGTLELWPSPQRAEHGRVDHEIREGHIISRPPSTGIAHFFRAGTDGMRFLAYGTREANDIGYYPRSNRLYFRGLGLIGRLESLSYDDGEPED
jgi:hypothetical protein